MQLNDSNRAWWNDPDQICALCLESIRGDEVNARLGDPVLSCFNPLNKPHVYHATCIAKQLITHGKDTCPECRAPLDQDTIRAAFQAHNTRKRMREEQEAEEERKRKRAREEEARQMAETEAPRLLDSLLAVTDPADVGDAARRIAAFTRKHLENSNLLIEAGVLPRLVALLSGEPGYQRTEAAHAMRQLSRLMDNWEAILASGAVSHLVRLARPDRQGLSIDEHDHAVLTLANLVSDAATREHMLELGIVSVVSDVLMVGSGSSEVARGGAAMLVGNLVQSSPQTAERLFANNVVGPLILALRNPSYTITNRTDAAFALGNLAELAGMPSTSAQIRADIAAKGGVEHLAQLLNTDDEQAQQETADALSSFCNDPERVIPIMTLPGVELTLKSMMAPTAPELSACNALRVLKNILLLKRTEHVQHGMQDGGGPLFGFLPLLAMVAERPEKEDYENRRSAVQCISLLAQQSVALPAMISNVMRMLLTHLEHAGPGPLRLMSANALKNLTDHKGASYALIMEFVQLQGLRVLLTAFGNPSLSGDEKTLLLQIVLDFANLHKYVGLSRGPPSFRVELVEMGFLEAIAPMIQGNSTDLEDRRLRTVAMLAFNSLIVIEEPMNQFLLTFTDANAVQKILQLRVIALLFGQLYSVSNSLFEAALSTLFRFSKNTTLRNAIVDENQVQWLLPTLREHADPSYMMRTKLLVQLLANMAKAGQVVASEICARGGIPILVGLMNDPGMAPLKPLMLSIVALIGRVHTTGCIQASVIESMVPPFVRLVDEYFATNDLAEIPASDLVPLVLLHDFVNNNNGAALAMSHANGRRVLMERILAVPHLRSQYLSDAQHTLGVMAKEMMTAMDNARDPDAPVASRTRANTSS
tara:strand:- start:764 stop:3391 length:2628 start_codon:yes stop_codon:yes gene_type:complete